METLVELGCELIHCCYGEADPFIAQQFMDRPMAFAVLSNDSDFCVMRSNRFIPDLEFDLEDSLGLRRGLWDDPRYTQQPILNLVVDVVTPDRVAAALGLSSHKDLVEWVILRGNDFTAEYIREIQKHIGFSPGCSYEKTCAELITKHKSIGRIPAIMPFKTEQLRAAVQFSRRFYAAQPIVLDQETDIHSQHLIESVKTHKYPVVFLAINAGCFWYKMVYEVVSESLSIEEVLLPLRKITYFVIQGQPKIPVVETGKIMSQRICKWQISCEITTVKVPSLLVLQELEKSQRRELFHLIISHFGEDTMPHHYFEFYEPQLAYLCYVLRYLLVLSSQYSPLFKVTEEEVATLLVTAISKLRENEVDLTPPSCRPIARCLQVASYFQMVYKYLYQWMGKLLQLSEEFPKPSKVFSGALFATYFMASQNEDFGGISFEQAEEILSRKEDIITKYKSLKEHIDNPHC